MDFAFKDECQAAQQAGFETYLINADALDEGAFDKAVRHFPQRDNNEIALYRGWMVNTESYRALYEALSRRRYVLMNNPDEYRHAHHLPESYSVIRDNTPKTVWTTRGPTFERSELMALLAPFGDVPIIVKDFVKSQKYHWKEACFIPSAQDAEAVSRVTARFVELQGDDLTGGLVFREFVELAPLTTHSKSGMPLTKEFRMFVLYGKPLLTIEYWEEGEYCDEAPPQNLFGDVAAKVQSRFFTMDVARCTNGRWIIIELGDAQVAGIPERLHPKDFYEALAARFC